MLGFGPKFKCINSYQSLFKANKYINESILKKFSSALSYIIILIAIFMVGQVMSSKSEVEIASSSKNQSLQSLHKHENLLFTKGFCLPEMVILAPLCRLLTIPVNDKAIANIVIGIQDIDLNTLSIEAAFYCLLLLFSSYLIVKKSKFKTPKIIINMISIVLSWIKPIKGCPT
jgi:hypothetical protein